MKPLWRAREQPIRDYAAGDLVLYSHDLLLAELDAGGQDIADLPPEELTMLVVLGPVCDCEIAYDLHVHVVPCADPHDIFGHHRDPLFNVGSSVDRYSILVRAS